MLTQKDLKREIFSKKESLSENSLFLSEEYGTFLTQMAQGITGCNFDVSSALFCGDKNRIAYTDGKKVNINYKSMFTDGLNKLQKHMLFCGLNLHECGHVLFTDFMLNEQVLREMSTGKIYPSPAPNDYLEDLKKFLQVPGNHAYIADLFHSLDNCIEDGFVNRAVMASVPGYAQCLKYGYQIHKSFNIPYEKMLEMNMDAVSAFINLTLSFAVHGVILFTEDFHDEVSDMFREVIPYIENAVFEADPIRRKKAGWAVFCYLFHFIEIQAANSQGGQGCQDQTDSNQEGQSQNGSNQSGTNGQNQSSSNQNGENGKSQDSDNQNSGEGENQTISNQSGNDGQNQAGDSQNSESAQDYNGNSQGDENEQNQTNSSQNGENDQAQASNNPNCKKESNQMNGNQDVGNGQDQTGSNQNSVSTQDQNGNSQGEENGQNQTASNQYGENDLNQAGNNQDVGNGQDQAGNNQNGNSQSSENGQSQTDDNPNGKIGQNRAGENAQNQGNGNQIDGNLQIQGNENGMDQAGINQDDKNRQSKTDGNQGGENGQGKDRDSQEGKNRQGDMDISETLKKMLEDAGKQIHNTENTEHSHSEMPNEKAIAELAKKLKRGMEMPSPDPVPDTVPESLSDELDTIAEKVAMSVISNSQEKEIESQMVCDIKEFLDGANILRKVGCIPKRTKISPSAKKKYDSSHAELDVIVKRLVSAFQKEIKDRQIGDTLTGLYMGKRFSAREAYRYDKRTMSRKIAPEDIPDMNICILIDMSGSMSGKKIETAKKCAYITYQFCEKLKIPCSIIGHSTWGNDVILENVCDEQSIDKKDSQRIFSIRTYDANRDGYAVWFCIKKLEKAVADQKLLMVISDGMPNHNGYGINAGRAECQAAVKYGIKHGITTIAAAIEDPSGVRSVYKDGVSEKNSAEFLDITDLNKLPKTFVKIIKRRLA